MATAPQWSFAGYTFPYADSPKRGGSDDWNLREKLIEHDPLNANVTILTSWGFKSSVRTIQGICNAVSRDQLKSLWTSNTVGTLTDSEGRAVTAKITDAKFSTITPEAVTIGVGAGVYQYSITFMER